MDKRMLYCLNNNKTPNQIMREENEKMKKERVKKARKRSGKVRRKKTDQKKLWDGKYGK